MQKFHIVLGCLAAIAGLGIPACTTTTTPQDEQPPAGRIYPKRVMPNVVVVMLDDVGFGHLSTFGGPVRTPNIDRVAARGLRYTNFHTTALCSPSRAAFLTGRNHHSVGTGKITELASDEPGYTGRIPKSAATFAQILREHGYSNYALGKWHNTPVEDVTPDGPYDLWPRALGFDHFYGFLGAEANQWAPTMWQDRRSIDPGSRRGSYLLDRDLGDHAVGFIREKDESGEPFFLYLAPGSGHAPHHAPQDYIDRNKGRFDRGWDVMRAETFENQKKLGIMPDTATLPARPDVIPAWETLEPEAKRLYARMQEVNAAALEHADTQLGRVLDELDTMGMTENTIVIVTSDNGASGEGGLFGTANIARIANDLPARLDVKSIDDLGTAKAFGHYPAGWALAANTPGQYWKQSVNEGGVRDPFVIAWPKGISAKGELRSQFTHMIDIAPTLLDLVGVEIPSEVEGTKQMPFEGTTFSATLDNAYAPPPRDKQYFEMFGNRALWANGWKAVAFHGRWPWDTKTTNPDYTRDHWSLYDLEKDPNETVDLADRFPDRLMEMKALFDRESHAHHVLPLDDSTTALIPQNARRLLGDRKEFTYDGTTRATPEPLSPPVKNRSHSIVAKVRVPKEGANGVLVAAGGHFGGYALYVENERLVYVHNFVGDARYVVVSSTTVKPGERELRFDFEKTGPNAGKGRLYIDNVPSGEGDIPQTVPLVYSLNETFDTGLDTGTAAGDYEVPFAYEGRLRSVKVTLDENRPTGTAGSSEHGSSSQ
jgi:arylsulfatase A-like enzyme